MATVDDSQTVQSTGLAPTSKLASILNPSLKSREAIWFYIFVSPWLLAFLAFGLGPMIASFLLGFTKYNAIKAPEFVGTNNFRLLYSDPIFWKSMRVTFTFTGIFVPLQLGISLFLAALLNLRVFGMRFIRADICDTVAGFIARKLRYPTVQGMAIRE
ncbi:MAG: hypothetical protein AAF629_13060 [Chloroflexota bacterium]